MGRHILLLGPRDSGKTTLANALLGWDVLPQGMVHDTFPTRQLTPVRWEDRHILTDSPGYEPGVVEPFLTDAIQEADTVLILTGGDAEEVPFLKGLPLSGKQVFLVVNVASGDWSYNRPPRIPLRLKTLCRLGSLVRWNPRRVFCLDAMAALIASIEDDRPALIRSGILPLRKALRK